MTFEGVSEYAEYLVTRIEAPSLAQLHITIFNESIPNIPHLLQFISRVPKFQAPDEAHIYFSDDDVMVTLRSTTRTLAFAHEGLMLRILRGELAGQLSSLTRLCRSFLPALATVERLFIRRDQDGPGVTQHNHWLELLELFTGAKNLYLCGKLTPRIAPILQELVGERTTIVLPVLQNLFLYKHELRGPIDEAIGDFIAARQLSGHPIAIRFWGQDRTCGA